MVTHHPKDGHPPSKINQKEEYYRLEIWHLDQVTTAMNGHPQDGHYHPKDDYPPSKIKIYQNEVYYRLGIWHLDLIPKIKIR